MDVTETGIEMDASALHWENVLVPITGTRGGMLMEFNELHPLKA